MNKFRSFFVLMFFFASSVWAATPAYTNRSNVPVKGTPSSRASNVVVLKMGQKVMVQGRKGSWYKVSVNLPGGFEVQGWVVKGTLARSRKSKARPSTRRVAPKRRPARQPKNSNDIFGTTPTRRPPSRRAAPRTQSRKSFASKPRSSNSKGKAEVTASFLYFTQDLASASGNSFAYSLTGPALTADLSYEVWQLPAQALSVIVGARYTYGLLSTDTNLQDTASSTFDTRKKKNKMTDLQLIATAEKDFARPGSKPLAVGVNLGYQIYNFTGDDIENNSGTPLSLYVSHKISGFLAGSYLRLPLSSLTLNFGVDALLAPNYEEDPADSTGVDPAPKLALMPKISAGWTFGASSGVELGYQMRYQKVSHTGNVTRAGQAISDVEVTHMIHSLGVSYEYRF